MSRGGMCEATLVASTSLTERTEMSDPIVASSDAISTFKQLQLCGALQETIRAAGYVRPTPIQAQGIPPVLAGRDLLGCAQTGTGKTAAFALPILEGLLKAPRQELPAAIRVLVLAPTRELAAKMWNCLSVERAPLSTCLI